ncbi:MAG: TRAP transporter large permease subunit, partial [Gammaproteobacteria bacterium]|nr:TRAP transporter large permease subunit [Gammaproteobacteria bacterium]
AGAICASGTLGQIIPPSIVLVLLGDVLSSAYQQSQLDMGIFSPESVSVGDLFAGALIPGLILVCCYIIYLFAVAYLRPGMMPLLNQQTLKEDSAQINKKNVSLLHVLSTLIPPLLLIVAVLGSILGGIATPTEAASVGAVGAMLLALQRAELNIKVLYDVARQTTLISSMVFMILIGASIFSLVFRGFGGDELVRDLLSDLPGGVFGAVFIVMLIMFLLGFVLDFIEITFVVVPIVGPVLLGMGLDPVWLGIMIALNLQTSFLTPPFGFALFYLRGVASDKVTTMQIYRGVVPFIMIQLFVLALIAYWPEVATWLPDRLYGD